ncbi:Shedu anti-phage system protein SduA domain-containing protein [Micromonospora aurantiaca (nom. illeg.)]|uniref:Shedu anti-phage system protein SduA domain-containing protein n=1 Tax=Micromonospora aurantiaca (nom. illeg.) TaxID=47850 RepID=UPI003EBCF0A8
MSEEPRFVLQLTPKEGARPSGRLEAWINRAWKVPVIMPENLVLPGDLADDEFDELMIWFCKAAREAVFGMTAEGKFYLAPIGWVVTAETDDVLQELRPLARFIAPSENLIKGWIFQFMIMDLPITSDNQEAAIKLSEIYKDLRLNGASIQLNDGSSIRVSVDPGLSEDVARGSHSFRAIIQPFELVDTLRELEAERLSTRQAKSAIRKVDKAISELTTLLERTDRNEHDLQRCLTENPILFGPSYRRLIPKHRLGSEYEVDYALELIDGSIDVMEIEASTHTLYTKGGNPTAAVIHAEQQVLDWLSWLEENSAYARANLSGVRMPAGFVVIGRRSTLSARDSQRLAWRNRTYGSRVQILTFDDLIDRCLALRSLLLEETSST